MQLGGGGYWYIGALVGYVYSDYEDSRIQNCWTSGEISFSDESSEEGTVKMGGFVGNDSGDSSLRLADCYNFANISYKGYDGTVDDETENNVGGIIGSGNYYCLMSRIYNAGTITASENATVGALSGHYYGTFTNCFYHKGTSNATQNGADGLTDKQMQDKNYFTSFDFDTTWEVDSHCSYKYPQLKDCRQVQITNFELSAKPSKLEYYTGEALDITGATVNVTYEDGIETGFSVTAAMLEEYDMEKIGEQDITVRLGNATATFTILVKARPVTSVSLSQSELLMYKGNTATLTATVLPENASDRSLEWDSSNSSVATVVDGKVTAIGNGTATLTATSSNGIVASCTVTVTVPVVSLQMSQRSLTMYAGETKTLSVVRSPLESKDAITWESSEESVAKVADGIVTAYSAGSTTISAVADNGVSAECTLTVKSTLDGYAISGLKDVLYSDYSWYDYYDKISMFTVTNGSNVLSYSSDYSVTIDNDENVGTATVTVTGKGYYEGTLTATFQIYVPTYTVCFMDGADVLKTQTVSSGEDAAPPIPAKAGYLFAGWSGSYEEVTSDVTVSALWRKVTVAKAGKPTLKNTKKRQIAVTYKRVSGADGYVIRYSTNKKMSKAQQKFSNTLKKNLNKLKKGKKYYVQVAAYKTDSTGAKVYGAWSAKKSLTVKK